MSFLKGENAQTEVLPLVNNFDPITNEWRPELTAPFMNDPAARARFRKELSTFLASDKYHGLTFDIEAFPLCAHDDYRNLVQKLYDELHAKGLKLYVAVPVNDKTSTIRSCRHLRWPDPDELRSALSGRQNGAIAGQDWFIKNLQDRALKVVPQEKIICASATTATTGPCTRATRPPRRECPQRFRPGGLARCSRFRIPIEFHSDSPESPLFLPGRKRRAARSLVPGRGYRPKRDAGGTHPRHQDLCVVAPGLGGPFALVRSGTSLWIDAAYQASRHASRSGRRHRRRGRSSAH